MKQEMTRAFFYHIYPLGLCGCPDRNDFCSPAGDGLRRLAELLPSIAELGCNALYIGPLFESTAHGYDTVDYFHVDRRLGNNEDLRSFVERAHSLGIAVALDAVFNHTGRDFFAFKDIQAHGEHSAYRFWYKNIQFGRQSCFGDPFEYEGWAGCKDLAKLDGDNGDVRNHLFSAVKTWIEEFKIDGLRLDAADVLSFSFMDALASHCKTIKEDFFLIGEVVHGDYNQWLTRGRLDSVTNYQLYKGLWSSFNDGNFFEIAHNLEREFGAGGLYKNTPLYNFADNHDVDRVASVLKDERHLFPLYGMLFTMPGVPSLYYGSERGVKGRRQNGSDRQLRPMLPPFAAAVPDFAAPSVDSAALTDCMKRFAAIRNSCRALQCGSYRQLAVANKQFAFARNIDGEEVIAAFNASFDEAVISLNAVGTYEDILNGGVFTAEALRSLRLPACWLRVLKRVG